VRQRKDDLLAHTLDLFQDAFYGNHPLHKPVQGSEDTIEALKLEDVVAFRKRVYCPAGMVFSCAGDFEPDIVRDISTKIVEELGEIANEEESGGESKVSGTGRTSDRPHGEEQGHRNTREERDSSAAWIVLGYPAPSFGDDGYHEMQVVNAAPWGVHGLPALFQTERRERARLSGFVGLPGIRGPQLPGWIYRNGPREV